MNVRKCFVTDSGSCHFGEDVNFLFKKNSVVLGVTPDGITQYIQVLDLYIFSIYDSLEKDIEKR